MAARKFRFDSDRYVDGPIDTSQVKGVLCQFADDIYAAFSSAKGPALEEWMLKGGEVDDS